MHTERTPATDLVTSAGSPPAAAKRPPYRALLDAVREIADRTIQDTDPRAELGHLRRIAERALSDSGLTNALRLRLNLEDAQRRISELRAGRRAAKDRIKALRREVAHVARQRDAAKMLALAEVRSRLALELWVADQVVQLALRQAADAPGPTVADVLARISAGAPSAWAARTGRMDELTGRALDAVARATDVSR